MSVTTRIVRRSCCVARCRRGVDAAMFGAVYAFTFMGRPYSEGELIGFGFALEQATKARRAPDYVPTLSK